MSVRVTDNVRPVDPAAGTTAALEQTPGSVGLLKLIIILFVALATLGPVFTGPLLGDHEALVAQCAREMRTSGNWLVPHYLGEAYVRKPPLPYWMIAGLSYVFPADATTGLPVTTTLARLPSAIASFGTVMLLWAMASCMFGRRVGRVAAVLAGSSLFFLLYAANATVEMILTFCCTWAYAHFWFAIQHPVGSGKRRLHLLGFYLALGAGMMAKGPFPLVMVAFPIAVWWYTEHPLSFVATGGQQAWGLLMREGRAGRPQALQLYSQGWLLALRDFFQGLLPRTVRAFRELWLIPGLIVFALCFVPWMIAVGKAHPHAWDLWNWQYWQRAQGNYDDTRDRGPFYYVGVIGGLILPWLFLVFEAAASPWIRKYARDRRALLFAGLWALIGAGIMSAVEFKKPYYISPMIPGLVLMLAVVADRFYSTPLGSKRLAWVLWAACIPMGIGAVIGGYIYVHRELPSAAIVLTALCALTLTLLLVAGFLFINGRAWAAFGMTAATSVLAFAAGWYWSGEKLDNIAKVEALNDVFVKNNVPADAKVYWISRPDSRLSFYYNRITQQMVQPAEIVAAFQDRTKVKTKAMLQKMIKDRAISLVKSPAPVYLVLDRDEYSMAKIGILELTDLTRLIGFAPDDSKKESDWMVITNVKENRHAVLSEGVRQLADASSRTTAACSRIVKRLAAVSRRKR